jgi:hypothetical protein
MTPRKGRKSSSGVSPAIIATLVAASYALMLPREGNANVCPSFTIEVAALDRATSGTSSGISSPSNR